MEDNLHNTSVNQTISKLSADPGALVIGIISVVVVITGCCCGVLAIPVLILSLIGWIWAAKSKKAYLKNPEAYLAKSYSNVNTGLIMNMICTILVGILLIIGLFIFGASLFNPETYFDEWEKRQIEQFENEDAMDSSDEIDTWKYEDAVDSTATGDQVIEVEEYDQYNDSI